MAVRKKGGQKGASPTVGSAPGIIDIGVGFDEALDKSGFKPLPEGVYMAEVNKIEQRSTQAGRPSLLWTLKVMDGPHMGKNLFYNTPLPWSGPNGYDDSGLGFLVNIAKALGKPWSGSGLDPNIYIGLSAKAIVIVDVNDLGEERNRIKKFL